MNDYLQICAEFFRQPEGHALLIVIGLLAITPCSASRCQTCHP